ncbi:exodeoxyribonuclease VII large subunit [Clostridiaceae bacterium M8S5]|nr:exodeoxyribonuclease VII large subunit [Clostridiaceae bacterium M8S5]
MNIKPLKVSDLNKYIKRVLNTDPILNNIYVQGEVSNLKQHFSGNLYFSLKDENSKLNCVMFSSDSQNLKVKIKNGDNLILKGNISVYDRDGAYQLYVKDITVKGLGQLHIAFEELKNKLETQGLFDKSIKKSLPFIPNKIGVVTSATGAAVRDIITVIKRRYPKMDILIYPVLVQGKTAHQEICRALRYLDAREDVDIIITGRGGGSIEELWTFNEEDTAREIHHLSTPVISAVGHETDFTIADFVSDYRAPTPSAAGEIAVPEYFELSYKLDDLCNLMIHNINKKLEKKKYELKFFSSKLKMSNPDKKIEQYSTKVNDCMKRILTKINHKKEMEFLALEKERVKLHSYSPLAVLERGYSIVKNNAGEYIDTARELSDGEIITVRMKDGEVKAKVIDKEYVE